MKPDKQGERLKQLRLSHNMTLAELAEKLGVSAPTIQRYETGEIANMKTTTIKTLSDIFGVSPLYIMGFEINSAVTSPIQEYRLCPSIAHAGTTDYNENEYYEPQYIKLPDELLGKYAGRKDIEFCKINGDSMNNIFLGHTIIGYLTDSNYYTLKAGDIVIFRYGTDLGVKRYYDIGDEIMFKADSHHPDFQDKEYRYPKDEYLQIIGKVVVYNVIM